MVRWVWMRFVMYLHWNRTSQSHRMGVVPIHVRCHTHYCIARMQNCTVWTLPFRSTQTNLRSALRSAHTYIGNCCHSCTQKNRTVWMSLYYEHPATTSKYFSQKRTTLDTNILLQSVHQGCHGTGKIGNSEVHFPREFAKNITQRFYHQHRENLESEKNELVILNKKSSYFLLHKCFCHSLYVILLSFCHVTVCIIEE